jgi:hypothetical protein
LWVKSVYLDFGIRRIKKADARGLEGPEREAYLQKAGGTSVSGAILGTAIMASVVALPFLALMRRDLPACDDPSVRELATELSARLATQAGPLGAVLAVDEFKELRASDPETTRRCQMTARANGKTARVVFSIMWEDEDKSQVGIVMSGLKIQALFE